MYRLLLNGLLMLLLVATVFSFFGFLPFTSPQLLFSALILIIFAYLFNLFFSKFLSIPINSESAVISALILTFISSPATNFSEIISLIVLAFLAMLSKYLLVIKRKHIFNPAAVSAFIFTLLGLSTISWWVATPSLLPFVSVLGFLVVKKIRRFPLLFAFLFASFLSISFNNQLYTLSFESYWSSWWSVLQSWPIVFFAAIMLTEPLTMPPHRQSQIIYGLLVGIIFGINFQWGVLYSTPQLALLIGNFFSFLLSSKQKLILTLEKKIEHGDDLYEFIFLPNQKLFFQAGQYLEWTLPQLISDNRGNRRYFTIASSPLDEEIHLVVRIGQPASSFKQGLLTMEKGQQLLAGQLAGDFLLPKQKNKKMVWIAGGIGITPFISMTKFLLSEGKKRQINFFYTSGQEKDFIFKELWEHASKKLGMKLHYVLTDKDSPKNWAGLRGRLTTSRLRKLLGELNDKIYYLSGPNLMVDAYKDLLLNAGVKRSQIMTDYFPGF